MTALEARITEEVRSLEHLGLEPLREAWRLRYGAPPTLRSVDLLRRMLAYRVQADAFGDLSPETRRLLRAKDSKRKPGARACVGTTITREHQGRRHRVEVVEGGFVYEGVTYASLSEIARVITGVRWNGPRFFGLRQPPKP